MQKIRKKEEKRRFGEISSKKGGKGRFWAKTDKKENPFLKGGFGSTVRRKIRSRASIMYIYCNAVQSYKGQQIK